MKRNIIRCSQNDWLELLFSIRKSTEQCAGSQQTFNENVPIFGGSMLKKAVSSDVSGCNTLTSDSYFKAQRNELLKVERYWTRMTWESIIAENIERVLAYVSRVKTLFFEFLIQRSHQEFFDSRKVLDENY